MQEMLNRAPSHLYLDDIAWLPPDRHGAVRARARRRGGVELDVACPLRPVSNLVQRLLNAAACVLVT